LYLHEMNWVKVREALSKGLKVAILPIGTVEAHGPHLPLGTDTIIPTALAERMAEEVDALIAPPVYYGVTKSLTAYPGSLRIRPGVFEELIYDILKGLKRTGFEAVIIMNGHGGGEQLRALRNAAFRAWEDFGLITLIINWWILAKNLTERVLGVEGGHGGADETAMIYAVRPDLVEEGRYSEERSARLEEGLEAYPFPASVIYYSERGSMVLDKDRSLKYFEEVANLIISKVKEYLNRFKREGLGLA